MIKTIEACVMYCKYSWENKPMYYLGPTWTYTDTNHVLIAKQTFEVEIPDAAHVAALASATAKGDSPTMTRAHISFGKWPLCEMGPYNAFTCGHATHDEAAAELEKIRAAHPRTTATVVDGCCKNDPGFDADKEIKEMNKQRAHK